MPFSYYLIYKPYNYLSQFTKAEETHNTLSELYDFPSDVYPVGRLDKDSEGLLFLTNDKEVVHKILDPIKKLPKTYYVQVEGIPSNADIEKLRKGVKIKLKPGKYYTTLPCDAEIIEDPDLPDRDPPIRFRKSIPTTWLKMTITEGKNRQIRKMCASIQYPVLRLYRYAIGPLKLDKKQPGEVQKLTSNPFQ